MTYLVIIYDEVHEIGGDNTLLIPISGGYNLEHICQGNSLVDHIQSNSTTDVDAYFQTGQNEVNHFIRETLNENPEAFPSYFAYNHPELMLHPLDTEQRIAIMMGDLAQRCTNIFNEEQQNREAILTALRNYQGGFGNVELVIVVNVNGVGILVTKT